MRPTIRARPLLRHARRLLVCVLVAGVLGAPLAVGWATGRTSVQDTVGITPTTVSLTTRGHSELRLGIAGSVYLPVSRGPFGVVATVDGPGDPEAGEGDLASYVTPRMLALYTGLFHDPAPAVQAYVDRLTAELWHRALLAEVPVALAGGLVLLLVLPLSGRRAVAICSVVLAASCTAGVLLARGPDPGGSAGTYPLPVLDGTVAAGSTTDSPLLRVLLGGAVPKVQSLVARQETQDRRFRDQAVTALQDQAPSMTGPRPGETAVLMQSDMHCNTTMIALQHEVVRLLRARFGSGVPAAMAITGDLTTNGTAAEAGCIRREAAIAGAAPVAAVTGNHESDVSVTQMGDAGMQVLDGSARDLAGLRVLGDADPSRSELFGATALRGSETEEQLGTRLRRVAEDDRPAMVLVHEAYAAQAFLGVPGMTDFLAGRGSATVREEDGIPDLPAGAVFYGHWHRSVEPRVVWNSDGTWTLVMELDTSGGAIDTPTLNHFSTPWSRPQQEASFPVVFWDRSSGLVTGYQLYRFETDGSVSVQPRVEVGAGTTR